jgi:hypothetical protein
VKSCSEATIEREADSQLTPAGKTLFEQLRILVVQFSLSALAIYHSSTNA